MLPMKKVVLKNFVAASIVACSVFTLSTFSAKAAIEVTESDAPPVEATQAAPAVPASDFNGTSSAPAEVKVNPERVVVPEPGTIFAGLGVLTYLLLKSGRRSRA